MFEGRHIDYRSSKVDTSIIDLRRSTHRSSVFERQHIHLRRSTHRDIDLRRSKAETSHLLLQFVVNIVHNCAPKSLEYTELRTFIRTYVRTCVRTLLAPILENATALGSRIPPQAVLLQVPRPNAVAFSSDNTPVKMKIIFAI